MLTTHLFCTANIYCRDFNENHKGDHFYNGCLNLMIEESLLEGYSENLVVIKPNTLLRCNLKSYNEL